MLQQENLEAMKAENHRLRQTLLVVVFERKKMASQFTGVQNLGVQLQKKEQELQSLLDKNKRLQSSLARAENRITQLSVLAGNGQTLVGQGAIVTPGVSKKVLEALTRENTKRRQALDHLTNRGQNGVDLAVHDKERERLCQQLQQLQNNLAAKTQEFNDKQKQIWKLQMEHKSMQNAHKERQRELQNDLAALNRECDNKQQQIDELQMEQGLMQDALAGYENDFKMEQQEKKKILSDQQKITREWDHVVRSYEQLRKEHIGLRQNIERMYSQAQAQQQYDNERERLRQQLHELQINLAAKTQEFNDKQKQIWKLQMERKSMQNAHKERQRELQNDLAALNRECDGKQQQIDELQMEQALVQDAHEEEKQSYSSLKEENGHLRGRLSELFTEGKKMTSEYDCVNPRLQKKGQFNNKLLSEKYQLMADVLARADNKMTQLTSQESINTPETSKKVLEALARENTRLKQALDCLTNNGPNDVDVAMREESGFEVTKRGCKDGKSQLPELQLELAMLRNVLAGYENDFNAVRDEKVKAVADGEKSMDQLKKEIAILKKNLEWTRAEIQALVPFASQAPDRLSVYDPIQADCMDAQDFHVLGNRLRPTMPRGYGLEPCADGLGPADLRDARDSHVLRNRPGRSCSPQLCIHSFGPFIFPLDTTTLKGRSEMVKRRRRMTRF